MGTGSRTRTMMTKTLIPKRSSVERKCSRTPEDMEEPGKLMGAAGPQLAGESCDSLVSYGSTACASSLHPGPNPQTSQDSYDSVIVERVYVCCSFIIVE